MWKVLQESGLVPCGRPISFQNRMPDELGIGMIDVGTEVRLSHAYPCIVCVIIVGCRV